MATPSKIVLSTAEKPEFWTENLNSDSAAKASELLQENHERHHVFFNDEGFHNHIVHHLTTLYALGASPDLIKRHYDLNKSYQRPAVKLEEKVIQEMHDLAKFKKCLGKEQYYHDFLVYFQNEIVEKGWEQVLNEYLFKGDDRADDLLVRTFSGFLHPLIHLGFGIEFNQPAIIAEGLAQAAVHSTWIRPLFLESERTARESSNPSKTLVQLLQEIQADKELVSAPQFEDANKIRDGILKRAPNQMLKYASQYSVKEEQLEEKTAEMINFAVYFTAAAQRPAHLVKFDFFFMHCVNSSIFFTRFLQLPKLSTANKIRLLEWKGRNDLAMYVSRGAPALLLGEIKNYKPKQPSAVGTDPWPTIIQRVDRFEDDGHASKLIRALAHGKRVCKKWEDKNDSFMIRGDMWDQIGHMVIDSVEANGPRWVRSAGFDEAWKEIPERKPSML